MTRHSKSNTDGAVFTYHERRNMKHGSIYMRLPSAAMKPWHHCALSLAAASDPVLTPQGVLYDREAILLNLLHQKKAAKAQLEQQRAEELRISKEHAARRARQQAQLEKSFEQTQQTMHETREQTTADDVDVHEQQTKTNFWLPADQGALTVAASDTQLRPVKRRKKDKSALRTLCPVTQSALKARDLISLKFTCFNNPIPKHQAEKGQHARGTAEGETDDDSDHAERHSPEQNCAGQQSAEQQSAQQRSPVQQSAEQKRAEPQSAEQQSAEQQSAEHHCAPLPDAHFVCPVCQAVLVNASKPMALRTGTVLCARCVEQFVLSSGRDPVTDVEIDLKTDVIRIHNSGTGFAGSIPDDCASKEVKLYRPSAR